ncbi:SDR family oxidoreductase [Devosia sp. 2618]|uniref:NAD-dependent epimerase/dehydratase family protein n=1 Tax=Devosia sp. 2618 TaxID=3156454 RepID=UPI003391EADD
MSRTAVIFGGCGFFGTHMARALSADPEVGRIVLADIQPPRELAAKADYVICDVRQPITFPTQGPVEIYNFAAVHTSPGPADWEYFWTNVAGATNVCRFAEAIGARRIVFTSSVGVYGPQECLVDERTTPRPVTAYGKSKLLAEQIHEDWQARSGDRRLLIVRPAVTFGEGERGNFERLASVLRERRFVYPARKDTVKACAPVEELARSIAFMAQFDEPVLRYIFAYPDRTTTEAINRGFGEAAGYAMPRLVLPEKLIMVAAFGFEVLGKVGVRTAINRERVRKLIRSTNAYPHELISRGFAFEIGLAEALRRWQQSSDFR